MPTAWSTASTVFLSHTTDTGTDSTVFLSHTTTTDTGSGTWWPWQVPQILPMETWQPWQVPQILPMETWQVPETDAQRQAREAERAREVEARVRAEALLRDCLTAEQAAQLLHADAFELLTASGRRYRVRRGRAGNVERLELTGHPTRRYCLHPADAAVPEADVMLAQKLLLESDEDAFLRIANELRLVA